MYQVRPGIRKAVHFGIAPEIELTMQIRTMLRARRTHAGLHGAGTTDRTAEKASGSRA